MDIKVILGSKIKSLRRKRKLSQEKFSELLGMNPRQIVRIEKGESFPTAENLEKILAVLDAEPHELFFREEFVSDEYLKNELIKNIQNLSSKNLKLLYLVVNNL